MGNKKKLLLVEDEMIIALAESQLLQKYNYNVVTRPSGEAAITYLQENRDIDLVLMDINLNATMDGTEAAKIILQEQPDLPIIFLSSHTEPEIVKKTEKITSYGYVVKSTGITVLDASIKMAFKLHEEKKQRIQNQKSLIASENKFSRLIEDSNLGFFILQDEKIVYINKNLAECFGYMYEEIANCMEPEDFIHPSDHARMWENITLRFNGIQSDNFNKYKAVRKDGTIFNVFITTVLIDYNNKPAIISATIDDSKILNIINEINNELYVDIS